MTLSTTRMRAMIIELRAAGLTNDDIARRAQLGRGAVYRFSQGDSRALADQFDKIAGLYAVVTHRPPEY